MTHCEKSFPYPKLTLFGVLAHAHAMAPSPSVGKGIGEVCAAEQRLGGIAPEIGKRGERREKAPGGGE